MTTSRPVRPSSPGGQGRLAEVLASRGGRAAPEAPFVIEHREALIYMLCEAAELEHGIMCQYLFAAFSLKQGEDEGLTAGELTAVDRWRKNISHVATEEMLHLALVHNLLSAIGAAPHFGRPNLPAPAHHYPAGVNLTLVPFGEQALQHFIFLERPEGMEYEGAAGLDLPAHEAVPLMSERDIVPQPQDFATVGHLYRSIEEGFRHLADKVGEENLFVGPARAQAIPDNFRWPELAVVTDVASAQRAIDTILEQGEGARGHWEHAHFGQFVQILDEYREMVAANPEFDPVRPVMFATVRRCERDDTVPQITELVTSRCGDLFNVSYEILLQIFERYFAHTEESDEQLATLADATVGIMLRVLRPLGNLITRLPVGTDHPGMTAGPSFELFYENDYLMPHREAAWALLEERLRENANFCALVQEIASDSVAGELAPVQEALNDVADSLAAHFADWGARSRFSSRDEVPAAVTAEASASKALSRRAASLAQAVASTEAAGPSNKRLVALFDEARVGVAEAGGTETARRLVESVLRPLAEAISGKRLHTRAKLARPRGVDAGATALDAHLWKLAQDATTTIAGWDGAPEAQTLLMEATATLQDLALGVVPANVRGARQAALRELMAGRAPEIRCAHNGPYLVTNAERVRLARRGDLDHPSDGALPLWRVRDQADVRRRLREQRLHRQEGPETRPRQARPVRRCPADGVRQPRHLPALGFLHRAPKHGLSHRRCIRDPERRADGRHHPCRSRLSLRRAQLWCQWCRSPGPGRLGAQSRAGDRGHQGRPVPDHRRDSAGRRAGGAGDARAGSLARALRPVPLRALAEQAVLQRHALVHRLQGSRS